MFLLSWILYPVALAALCLGCGLLVDRVAQRSIPRALLLPAGFAAVVVLATLLTILDATSELAAPALAVAALVGLVLGLTGGRLALRPAQAWLWPAVAMAIAFAALAAPVVLTGAPGLTGYARIVDLASQIDLAAYLVDHGRSLAGVTRDSSYHVVADQLLRAGYPGGAQAALGATAQVARIDVIWAWQPFMAWMGAMLALALYVLLSRAIRHPAARALAAGVAAQPTILYSYALASGVKELAAALFVALTAALLAVTPGGALPASLAIAAGLCAVNVGIAPWALVLLAVLFGPRLVAAVGQRRRLRIARRSWLLALVAVGLVAAPTITAAIRLEPLLRAGGPADLGNLAAPVPAWSAIGPWLTSDHRYPLAEVGTETPTAILAALVALLATVGLARAISGRDRGLYGAAAAAVIGVAVVVVQGTAWVELKAFAISAPLVVALAFAGAAALHGQSWRRWAGLAAGAGVAASILAGNLLVYRAVPLAPYERFAELEQLGERYGRQGPALHPSFDEYAGYLMRDVRLTALADVPDKGLRRPRPEGSVAFVEDLDAFRTAYLDRFKLIVVRRGDPAQSRPPSDWRLVRSTAYYDVYRRLPPSPVVVAHLPAPAVRSARFCRALRAELGRAGPRARIAYVAANGGALFEIPEGMLPPGWLSSGGERLARGPGRLVLAGRLARTGDYDVWIRGSFGRRVAVAIDGRPVGSVRWRESYPQHYEPLGRATLAAGEHRVDVVRGGGSVLPGTGDEIGPEGIITRIGPVALVRHGPRPQVRTVGARAGMEACRSGRRLDWIEVVRPR